MKTKSLLFAAVIALFFASCTGRMYSFRKTYKVGEQETAITKASPVKEEAPVNEEMPATVPADETVTADASAGSTPAIIVPDYRNPVKQAGTNISQPSKKELVKTIKAAKKEIRKDVKGIKDSIPGFDATVRMLLLIGLICILIGIIVPFVGWVGGILVLVGLILWLINLI